MALTRKYLAALGIEAEKIDEIIQAHAETVEALKNERDQAKAEAAKLPDVQGELDALKESVKSGYVSKADHDKTVAEYQQYKADITAKEAKAAKESAVRAYFEGKQITGGNLEIAMRGSGKEIDAVELTDKGEIKDTAALDALIGAGGVYAGLITQPTGAKISTGAPLTGSVQPAPVSRAAQLYQQHYTALYGAQEGAKIT